LTATRLRALWRHMPNPAPRHPSPTSTRGVGWASPGLGPANPAAGRGTGFALPLGMRARTVVVGLAPAIAIALLLASPAPAGAYSVLSHESAVDEAWDRELRPLLL